LPRALWMVMSNLTMLVSVQSIVWLIIGPIIVRRFQVRCQHALDTLVINVAAAANHV
jgi:hypothetical protein